MSLRNIVKKQGSFPGDDALQTLFYLALVNIGKKRMMPLKDRRSALTRFTIQFEETVPKN